MGDLCATCMCNGRNLYYIGDTGFYHLYSQILNEIHVYESSPFYIRVCWECLAHLRKWLKFKEKAKQSYTRLQYIQQNNFQPDPEPPHLQTSQLFNFSYPETQIKTESDNPQPVDSDKLCPLDSDRVPGIKMEEETQCQLETQCQFETQCESETHCEPETFVHNLNLERKKRKREGKKVEKPIKEKSKKKIKPKREKIPKDTVKKKIKVKKKRSTSLDSMQDNHFDANNLDIEDDEIKDKITDVPEIKVETKKDVSFKEKNSRLNGAVAPKEPLPEKPYCVECGKNFSSRKTYRYHFNVLHKGQNCYPCPRCGKVYQWKSNLGRHLRSHKARDSGELYCETCDKRFASVATYRQHLRVSRRHVPESDFSFMCNECGKKFVNKTRLRDHIDWEHLKKIKFRCQLCNKPFKCHTSLYVHMQNVHRNKEKKDNLCHVCGKSYQNPAKLKYHIVAMHTSETPYSCQQCSAAFGWYSSLYRHVREVHYKMKLQPKKSKKSKKMDILPSLLPTQELPAMHQPGPP